MLEYAFVHVVVVVIDRSMVVDSWAREFKPLPPQLGQGHPFLSLLQLLLLGGLDQKQAPGNRPVLHHFQHPQWPGGHWRGAFGVPLACLWRAFGLCLWPLAFDMAPFAAC